MRKCDSMILFLTSSPSGPLGAPNDGILLDESNGFVNRLRDCWQDDIKGLIISSDPENFDGNDEMAEFFGMAFPNSGLPMDGWDVWDFRSEPYSEEDLNSYGVILLAGGHVPTQNAFFHLIGLKDLIQAYEGIVIGVSAGTMNCAELVYAQPELPGEAIDPGYQRFIEGLGLTDIMVLPHYEAVKDDMLDGMRLFEDITYQDSFEHEFTVLVDGSYIMIADGETRLFGEAYEICDGILSQICRENESVLF